MSLGYKTPNPEKIWVFQHGESTVTTDKNPNRSNAVEYIRSDLAPQWTPTSEKVPDNGRTVLVVGGIAYYDYEKKVWMSLTGIDWPGREITWDVDCWTDLPLPNPPEPSDAQEVSE